MKQHRPERVSALITEQLGKILLKEIEAPEGVLLTITDVEVSKDLEHANVKVSVYPSNQAEAMMKILEKKQGHFQFTLSRKLNIRPMPRIVFKFDVGLEKAALIEKRLLEDESSRES